jgi:hypothetical protein
MIFMLLSLVWIGPVITQFVTYPTIIAYYAKQQCRVKNSQVIVVGGNNYAVWNTTQGYSLGISTGVGSEIAIFAAKLMDDLPFNVTFTCYCNLYNGQKYPLVYLGKDGNIWPTCIMSAIDVSNHRSKLQIYVLGLIIWVATYASLLLYLSLWSVKNVFACDLADDVSLI